LSSHFASATSTARPTIRGPPTVGCTIGGGIRCTSIWGPARRISARAFPPARVPTFRRSAAPAPPTAVVGCPGSWTGPVV